MRKNRFRELLSAGQPTLGTHILSGWPNWSATPDYVEFTAAYAPFSLHDLENLGRAFEVAGLAGMVEKREVLGGERRG